MSIAEIEKMSVEEQIDTMEQIWSALSRNETSVKSPEWHSDVLAERKMESGQATFYTLDEENTFYFFTS